MVFVAKSITGVLVMPMMGARSPQLTSVDTSMCTTPVFSQPFLSWQDTNSYTLVSGQSADNFSGAGWVLSGGASLVTTTLADGRTGSAQLVRTPKTPEEARKQVRELKAKGVDGIKAILEAGWGDGMLYDRLDLLLVRAVSEEAHLQHLPL